MRLLLTILLFPFLSYSQTVIQLPVGPASMTVTPGSPDPCAAVTPTVRTLNTTAPNEIYRPNTSSWNPGDTLRIRRNTLSVLEIYGGGGTACHPIIIDVADTNTLVVDVVRFKGYASHYKIISRGSGTDTTEARSIVAGNVALSHADHIEVNGLEITGGSLGIYAKVEPAYNDPTTWGASGYVMTGNRFIGNWIHDVDGEGMYIGHTSPYGFTVSYPGPGDTSIIPIVTDSTIIAYNTVVRCGWDGIQLSNGREGNAIYGNIIRHVGLEETASQMAGIILGGNTAGAVYNNSVYASTGNGIQIFGYGDIPVWGNTVDTAGEAAVFANSYPTTDDENDDLQAIHFHDNHIAHPVADGALRLYNDFRGHAGHLIEDNTFCIPGATGSWQDTYFTIYTPPSSTLTNNTLDCE
jgi:hypothetical protein